MRALALASITASIAAAACGGPSSARGGDASASGLDVGMAFAPTKSSAAALAALAVPIERAKALIDTIPEDERGDTGADPNGDGDPDNDPRPTAYDLDRDGTVDLVAFPQVMYGPSNGWLVHAAAGGKLQRLFAVSGGWADVRVERGAVALRFEARILAPGEPRFSTTLRFAKRAWDPPIKSYLAQQTKVPAPRPPYASFTTRGPARLRTAPAVDDTPNPSGDDAAAEAIDHTATLRGNVVATYGAGARGTLVASEGAWRYVAFDPATKPKETSLSHGMDTVMESNEPESERPPNRLLSDAWLCGWIAAAEIDVRK